MSTGSLVSHEAIRTLQQENIRLKNENQDLHSELTSLRQALRSLTEFQETIPAITPRTDVFAILYRILTSALAAVNSDNASLLLLDEESGELVFVESNSPYRAQLLGVRLPAGEGIAGWVVANRTPKLVEDVRHEPLFFPRIDAQIGFMSRSIICVPLLDGERPLGALEVVNSRSGEPFLEKDLDVMMLVGGLAAQALARAEGRIP
jgi:GAF domain-containing protein